MIPLVALGVLSVVAQVVLLRELASAFFGVELLYILALAAWLVGTAAGAAAARLRQRSHAIVAAAFAAAGALVMLAVVFLRQSHALAGGVPGAYLPFPTQLVVLLLAVVPTAGVLGALFPWLATSPPVRSGGLAGAYGFECAGALAGGLVVTALVKLGMSTLALAAVGAAVAAAGAVSLDAAGPRGAAEEQAERGRSARWRAAGRGALALAAGGLVAAGIDRATDWDLRLMAWARPSTIETIDTPYGRVTVSGGPGGQVAVYANGALVFDSEETSAEVFAALAAAQHASPGDTLVLGGTLEGVARELAPRVAGEVTAIELDQIAYERVARHLSPEAGPIGLPHRPVRVRFGDPRRLIDPQPRFDLIVNAMPEPASAQASRFYTREFVRQCHGALRPGGILALRLPSSENFWPPALVQRNGSVARTLGAEFEHVSLVPSATLYLFASDQPLPDGVVVAARLRAWPWRARLATPAYADHLYRSDRRYRAETEIARSGAPAITDARPLCYQQTLTLWLSRFYPSLAAGPAPAAPGNRPWPGASWPAFLPAAAAVVTAAVWWARRRRPRVAVAVVALAGWCGMLVESVALLQIQITRGVVYEEVGALIACFMGGMAAGVSAFARWRAGSQERPPAARELRAAGLIAAALGVALGIGLAVAVRAGGGMPVAASALVVGGALVGLWFGVASRLRHDDGGRAASALYAADVAGGAAGALAATLLLVPVLGLDGTALAAAAGAAAAFALLL